MRDAHKYAPWLRPLHPVLGVALLFVALIPWALAVGIVAGASAFAGCIAGNLRSLPEYWADTHEK